MAELSRLGNRLRRRRGEPSTDYSGCDTGRVFVVERGGPFLAAGVCIVFSNGAPEPQGKRCNYSGRRFARLNRRGLGFYTIQLFAKAHGARRRNSLEPSAKNLTTRREREKLRAHHPKNLRKKDGERRGTGMRSR